MCVDFFKYNSKDFEKSIKLQAFMNTYIDYPNQKRKRKIYFKYSDLVAWILILQTK